MSHPLKLEVSGVVNNGIAEEDPFTKNRIRGISNTKIGARYNILEPNGVIPALDIKERLLLKFQKEEFRRENLGGFLFWLPETRSPPGFPTPPISD